MFSSKNSRNEINEWTPVQEQGHTLNYLSGLIIHAQPVSSQISWPFLAYPYLFTPFFTSHAKLLSSPLAFLDETSLTSHSRWRLRPQSAWMTLQSPNFLCLSSRSFDILNPQFYLSNILKKQDQKPQQHILYLTYWSLYVLIILYMAISNIFNQCFMPVD